MVHMITERFTLCHAASSTDVEFIETSVSTD